MSILKPVENHEVGMRPTPVPERVRRLVGISPAPGQPRAPLHDVDDIPATVARTPGFTRWSLIAPVMVILLILLLTPDGQTAGPSSTRAALRHRRNPRP